jgi:hypothetical protein
MPNLVGTGLNQVPTNGMLGGLAYQSPDHASIKDLDLKYLSQINASTGDTAVDVFVYDTSRDTDGGAWRQRTQHTSWYNETLNTETRGSRREFPAVAVIVATSSSVTIYDGDDPDLPMWMVFTKSSDANVHWIAGDSQAPVSSSTITAINGIISSGISDAASGRLTWCNFISDEGYNMVHVGKWKFNGGIGTRNDGLGWNQVSSTLKLVNRKVNDVAMTVLPTAPIDPDTGLQVPTIAVATDGGVSVIKDDGNVVDGFTSITSIVGLVRFDGNKVIYAADNDSEYKWIYQFDIPSADNTGNSYLIDPNSIITNYNHNVDFSTYSAVPLHYTGSDDQLNYTNDIAISNSNEIFVGAGRQLAKVQFIGSDYNPRTSLFSSITSTYNTGWQTWNIKGAFLSDTDATNVTGTELVTNGTFTTNTDGWTATNSTITIVSNTLKVDDNGGNSAAYQAITTVVGETYTISFDVVEITGLTARVHISTLEPNAGYTGTRLHESTELGSHAVTFIATGTTTYIQFSSESTYYVRYDNISVRIADPDRSVNNNGLQVFGTVTKSAVATGAELVAYSGFSNSNYLTQPYNSDMQTGNGDFSVMCWFKTTSTVNAYEGLIYYNTQGSLGEGFQLMMAPTANDKGLYWYIYGSTVNKQISYVTGLNDGNWHHVVATYNSNLVTLYVDGTLRLSGEHNAGGFNNSNAQFTVGRYYGNGSEYYWRGSLALVRHSASIPSAEQIKKMYEDEKVLFQENANATLYGSSDAVTALAYDEKTNLLHVGTSSGRSDFNGLRRINNTTEAVTTAISAYDGSIAQQ